MRAPLLLSPFVLLAACGQPAPQQTNTASPAPKETGYIARVQALPPGQREGVLFRAIRSSGGQSCQEIKQVEPLPTPPSGQPAWRVTCLDGGQWRVALTDDGTALVTGAQR